MGAMMDVRALLYCVSIAIPPALIPIITGMATAVRRNAYSTRTAPRARALLREMID